MEQNRECVYGMVSIITPVFNCEKYICDTIVSVCNQSYDNWELILIDDCSSDNSHAVINQFISDKRIRYYCMDENSGAAAARNKGLELSKGQYIAYLDSDDVWYNNKLKFQIDFMKKNDISFCCSSYAMLNEAGVVTKQIILPYKTNYSRFLKTTRLHTSGIVVDISKVDKNLLIMPNVRRGQDSATWAQILKNGFDCISTREVLHGYRQVKTSLSHDRVKAIKRTWYWYRKIEKLNIFRASFCFVCHCFSAIMKRM